MSDDEFIEFTVGDGPSSPQVRLKRNQHSDPNTPRHSNIQNIDPDTFSSATLAKPAASRVKNEPQRRSKEQQRDIPEWSDKPPEKKYLEEFGSGQKPVDAEVAQKEIVNVNTINEGSRSVIDSNETSKEHKPVLHFSEEDIQDDERGPDLVFKDTLHAPNSSIANNLPETNHTVETEDTSSPRKIRQEEQEEAEHVSEMEQNIHGDQHPEVHGLNDVSDLANAVPTDSDSAEHHHHKKNLSSHIEYHQDATGHIEKHRVYDDSGLRTDLSDEEDSSWQAMPTVGSHEVYDDKNNLLMQIANEDETEQNAAASGYTRVSNNDDAVSINSLDERTDYLFDNHDQNDDMNADLQMATTKSMLTDEQKIAYAGLCRLSVAEMVSHYVHLGKKSRHAIDGLHKWGQSAILRLYVHLDLSNEEQMMIESLASHNLLADDLTPCLKQVQKVKNGKIGQTNSYDDSKKEVDAIPLGRNARADEQSDSPPAYGETTASELHEDLSTSPEKELEVDVKWTIMCDLFLILIADGVYDARSRTLLMLVAQKLNVSATEVAQFERKVTEVLQIDDDTIQDWTEKDIIESRRRKALRKKYAYVGLATVGGGLVIGLSGGLLAPLLGAGLAGALGTIGIAGTSTFLAGAGGTAIIATTSTVVGASVGTKAMLRRTGHVKTFEFRPLFNNNRANLVITVSGWMTGKNDDVRLPFSTIDPLVGDMMSVNWEPELMHSLGQTINILATEALAFGVQQILAVTVFTSLFAALTAPMWLSKLSYIVDNPWSVSLDRAWAAGLIMADTLSQRKLGNRPTTLVGYGLGCRVIYSCLTELARRNEFGLIQDVYIFGTPVFYQKSKFAEARAVVSGRFVNGYSRKDWILAFLFPAAKRYGSVLGLDALPEKDSDDYRVENIDVSEIVDGHMNYREKMPTLLSKCGWPVLSEEFEDIDPNEGEFRETQRKLLSDLYSAEDPKKTGFFSSWKFDWMQRAKSKGNQDNSAANADHNATEEGGVLFDVDALRQELETLKPRVDFEQEPMPLPVHTNDELPIELTDLQVNAEVHTAEVPIKPTPALDYDDPTSTKPKELNLDTKRKLATDSSNSRPQLQFENLE